MNALNSLILEGNIEGEALMTTATTGVKVIYFTIAANRFYKNAAGENVTETSRFEVECYGEGYAKLLQHFENGRGVRLVGRLKQKCWKDEEGKSYSKLIVIAEHIEFKPKINK